MCNLSKRNSLSVWGKFFQGNISKYISHVHLSNISKIHLYHLPTGLLKLKITSKMFDRTDSWWIKSISLAYCTNEIYTIFFRVFVNRSFIIKNLIFPFFLLFCLLFLLACNSALVLASASISDFFFDEISVLCHLQSHSQNCLQIHLNLYFFSISYPNKNFGYVYISTFWNKFTFHIRMIFSQLLRYLEMLILSLLFEVSLNWQYLIYSCSLCKKSSILLWCLYLPQSLCILLLNDH